MSASANDNITQSMNGGSPVVTTVSSPRSIGGSSLSAVALTNWPTATRVFFTTYKKTTAGSKDFTTVTSWWAIASGTTLGTLTYISGAADSGNAVGDFIEMGPTDGWGEGIYQFGIAEHSSAGVHDPTKVAMLAGTQTFTGGKTFTGTVTVPNASFAPTKLTELGTWNQQLDPIFPTAIVQGTWGISALTGQYKAFAYLNAGAINDEINFKVMLQAGTYTFSVLTDTDVNRGIITFSVDGSSVGTQDCYSSSTVHNVTKSVTGISVATSGIHTISYKMASKNASSSNYIVVLSVLSFIRTA